MGIGGRKPLKNGCLGFFPLLFSKKEDPADQFLFRAYQRTEHPISTGPFLPACDKLRIKVRLGDRPDHTVIRLPGQMLKQIFDKSDIGSMTVRPVNSGDRINPDLPGPLLPA